MKKILLLSLLTLSVFATQAQTSKHNKPLFAKKAHPQASNQAAPSTNIESQGKIAQFGFARSAGFLWNGTQWLNFDTAQYVYMNGRLRSETKSFFGFPLARTFYSYDAAGRQTGITNQEWTSTAWQNETRDTLAFNSNGDLTLRANLEWNPLTSQWDSVFRTRVVITYNASNQPLLETTVQKDFGTPLETTDRNQYFYGSGRLIGLTYSFFDTLSSSFEKIDSTFYSYGTNNQLNQGTIFGFFGTIATPVERFINIVWNVWNGNIFTSLPSSYTYQEHNGTTFVTTSNYTFQYLGFGSSLMTEDFVDPLTNDARYWEYYDPQFNYRGNKSEERAGSNWVITGQDSTSITYDAQNRITETISIFWSPLNSQLTNSLRRIYFGTYTQILGTDEPISLNTDISLYPNPAKDVLHLKTDSEIVSIDVFDTQGRKVLQSGNGLNLDISRLQPGLYLVLVQTSLYTKNLNFIKE
jgi:hypothetical protein